MKKFATLVAFAVIVSLTSCGGAETTEQDQTQQVQQQVEQVVQEAPAVDTTAVDTAAAE